MYTSWMRTHVSWSFCPSTVNLMFLMSYWSVNCSTSEGVEALQMALHTLRMMALGGIHDHIAQVHIHAGNVGNYSCINVCKFIMQILCLLYDISL